MEMELKKYDIVIADFGEDEFAGEQAGVRPCVIIQNNTGNKHSCTTIVMALTTKIKKLRQPTHFLLIPGSDNGLRQESMVLGECIRQISKERIIGKIGSVENADDRSQIKRVYDANFGED